MVFPSTRISLIQRIADRRSESDWSQFVGDYWRPLRRFAGKWGGLHEDDAEDVVADLFEILVRKDILAKWAGTPNARLSTLLCSILRKLLANRHRATANRKRDIQVSLEAEYDPPNHPQDHAELEALWVDEILDRCMKELLEWYVTESRTDHFRVLYGKVCEGLSDREISDLLGIELTTTQSWFKHARSRLESTLKKHVRESVRRYASAESFKSEFEAEWNQLRQVLHEYGGLESAIRRSHAALDSLPPVVAAEKLERARASGRSRKDVN